MANTTVRAPKNFHFPQCFTNPDHGSCNQAEARRILIKYFGFAKRPDYEWGVISYVSQGLVPAHAARPGKCNMCYYVHGKANGKYWTVPTQSLAELAYIVAAHAEPDISLSRIKPNLKPTYSPSNES